MKVKKEKPHFYFKNSNSYVHKGFILNGNSSSVKLENNVRIYPNVIIEVTKISNLQIGENSVMSYGSLISCRNKIIIGRNVLIGEHVSIRDSTHVYDKGIIAESQDFIDKIIIGDNVWIGKGCIILPGTTIENNTVFASNSLIKGHYDSYGVYGGSIAKLIKTIRN